MLTQNCSCHVQFLLKEVEQSWKKEGEAFAQEIGELDPNTQKRAQALFQECQGILHMETPPQHSLAVAFNIDFLR